MERLHEYYYRNIPKIRLSLVFVLTLVGKFVCFSQEITYKPIGENDKPLPELYIKQECNNYEPGRFIRCFQLDSNSITLLTSYIKNYKFKKELKESKRLYGSYKVIIKNDNKKKIYILRNKKESYKFFKNQLYLLKNNAEFNVEVQKLMRRLE